jgi:hypothetical protein
MVFRCETMGGRSQGRVVAVTLVGKSIACRYPMAYNPKGEIDWIERLEAKGPHTKDIAKL